MSVINTENLRNKSHFYQISPSKNDSEDKSEFLISRGHWALATECTLASF